MKHLYKANMTRLLQNLLFIGGCAIAFVTTFLVSRNILVISFLANRERQDRMFFVSAAMVAFFTIFVPIFTNIEYGDGVIRNKMIAGNTQKQIYFSHLFTHFTAAGIMWGCYMLGGICAGTFPDAKHLRINLVFLLAVLGYIAAIMAISYRLKKIVEVVIFSMLIFSACFNTVMFGNAVIMDTRGNAQKIAAVFYNIPVLGQWFSNTGFADAETNPGTFVQLIISVSVTLILTFLGTRNLKKRDLE